MYVEVKTHVIQIIEMKQFDWTKSSFPNQNCQIDLLSHKFLKFIFHTHACPKVLQHIILISDFCHIQYKYVFRLIFIVFAFCERSIKWMKSQRSIHLKLHEKCQKQTQKHDYG